MALRDTFGPEGIVPQECVDGSAAMVEEEPPISLERVWTLIQGKEPHRRRPRGCGQRSSRLVIALSGRLGILGTVGASQPVGELAAKALSVLVEVL